MGAALGKARRRRAHTFIVVLVLAVLVLAACSTGGSGGGDGGGDNGEAGAPQRGGDLVFGIGAETAGLNPTKSAWTPVGYQVASAVFDPLFTKTPDGALQPYLAESMEPNDDFTEWMLKLRPGITFHDGTPLDATAVKRNIDGHLSSVLTGGAFRGLQSPEVVDDLTLILRTDFPWSALPGLLASQGGYIAAPSQLDAPDGAPQEPVGTGPFTLESRTLDESTTFVRNEDYWRDGFPYLDSVTFRIIPDPTTRVQALRSGELDIVGRINESDIAELRDSDDFSLVEDTADSDELMVMVNLAEPPFDALIARQALAYATDRQAFVDIFGFGVVEVADSPWGPESRWHPDTKALEHDLEKAKELVEEYEDDTGQDFQFTFLAPARPENRAKQELLLDQWKEAGIDARLDQVEQTVFIIDLLTNNFQAALMNLFPSPEPDVEAMFLLSDNVTNFPRNEDPEIDEAMAAARATNDFEERKAQYQIVAERLNEDLPYIWIHHFNAATAFANKVRGVDDATYPDGEPGAETLMGTVALYPIWISD